MAGILKPRLDLAAASLQFGRDIDGGAGCRFQLRSSAEDLVPAGLIVSPEVIATFAVVMYVHEKDERGAKKGFTAYPFVTRRDMCHEDSAKKIALTYGLGYVDYASGIAFKYNDDAQVLVVCPREKRDIDPQKLAALEMMSHAMVDTTVVVQNTLSSMKAPLVY